LDKALFNELDRNKLTHKRTGKVNLTTTIWRSASFLDLYDTDQSSIINHRPSIINHQPSIINHQSSIINHQSSITNHQSSITNHQSSIINHRQSTPIDVTRTE